MARTYSPLPANLALAFAASLLILPFLATFLLALPGKAIPFFSFNWMALAVGLVSLSMLPWVKVYDAGPATTSLCWPMIGLIALCSFQMVSLDAPYLAPYVTYLSYMLWALGLVILGATLKWHLGQIRILRALAWAGLIGGLVAALIGLLQIAGVPDVLRWMIRSIDRPMPIGNVAHPNIFTCHVFIGLLGLVYLFGQKKLALPWFLPVAILFAAALSFSWSRTLYLYFAVCILLTAWLELRQKNQAMQRYFLGLGFVMLAFLAFQWLLPELLEFWRESPVANASDRLAEYSRTGQLATRMDAWQSAWDIFLAHPWLGAGIGNFSWEHFNWINHPTYGTYSNPHNLVLFYLATTGLTGTGLLAVIVWKLLSPLISGLKHNTDLWLAGMILTVIILYSLLEFPLWLPAFLGLTAFLGGVLAAPVHPLRPMGKAAKIMYMIGILVASLFLMDTLQDYRKLAMVEDQRLPARDMETFARTARSNVWLQPYAERMFVKHRPATDQELAAMLHINTRLMRWLPGERTLVRQIILLQKSGRTAESTALFDKVSTLHPHLKKQFVLECQNQPGALPENLCLHIMGVEVNWD